MEVYTWSCNSLCSSWKNPRRALVLCIEVDGGKNMCCCQIIITGHCWTNKRLASQEERAMIRNNISQNWWIYYRVTKLTAFCEPYFITWSMNIVIANEWVIYIPIFIPQSRHHRSATCLVRTAVMVTSSWPGPDVTREHSELNTSRLLRVTATAELKMAWRRYPSVCRLLAPHDPRFPRTTLGASAVTLRTCDGLTLTRGHRGG